ncbi:hypothetical protein KSS87_014584, partial [Heliosperma pusillum]
ITFNVSACLYIITSFTYIIPPLFFLSLISTLHFFLIHYFIYFPTKSGKLINRKTKKINMLLMMEIKKGGISSLKGHEGLRIVQQIYESESNNIVVKYGLKSLTKAPINSSTSLIKSNLIINYSTNNYVDGDYCFLRSCHFCHKHLLLNQDVYMYRGDLGFCSIECRNKQIMLDERKEMEAKYKKRIANSPMDCHGCDTCKLLQDLRQRRNHRVRHQLPVPLLSIS